MKRVVGVVGSVVVLPGLLLAAERVRITHSESVETTATNRDIAMPSSVSVRVDGVVAPGSPITLVTVHSENAAPADVFADLAHQGGITLRPIFPGFWDRFPLKHLSVDADGQSFWPTALKIAEATGLQILPTAASPTTVQLSMRGWPVTPKPTSTSGPVTLQVDAVRHDRTVVLDTAPRTPGQPLQVLVSMYADPALKNFRYLSSPQVDEATDDQGNSLLPDKADASKSLAPEPGLITQGSIELAYPQNPGRRIAILRGSITLLVATQTSDWTIDNPAATTNTSRKLGRYTYTFDSLQRQGDRYELKLRIKGPANGGFKAAEQDLIVGSSAFLATDSAGHSWHISDIKGHYSAKEITATGYFDYTINLAPDEPGLAGDIATFTWRLPQELSNIEVPFEFHNLPLP